MYFNTLDYLATFAVSKMASYVFVWSKNRADIRDGNPEMACFKISWFKGHLQIILHLNKITECLKMTTFKIVFTFDAFFSAETTCTARWHVFYIRNGHISVSSFVYKYDQWPHDSHKYGSVGRFTIFGTYLFKSNIEHYWQIGVLFAFQK